MKFITHIDKITEFTGKAVAWLTSILVILICIDVTTRYLLNDTQVWIAELEWHLFALLFLFGAAYAWKHERHVRVDVFYSHFSEKDKAWVNLIGTLFLLIPWCIVIIWTSFEYAMESFLIGEGSPDPGGLPARYIIKFAIPSAIFMLLLQAISNLLKNIMTLQSKSLSASAQNKER